MMSDPERSPSLHRHEPLVTRRRLVGMTSAALAAPLAPAVARAQQDESAGTPAPASPIASPAAAIPIDSEKVLAVSTALVGVDSLNADYAEPLAQLIGADRTLAGGFDELASTDNLAADGSLDGLSDAAKTTATDILTYWYTGYFGGNPVENRSQIFFGLPVWGTVPYSTQPTLCKAFGYWAADPGVEG
jgi:hypothetical protein